MTEQPIARFAPDERTRLLAVRGVGPRVVERLEEIGIASLADLAIASAPDICGRTAAILGATCWKNSPQARAAMEAAIACAREE